MVTGRLNATPLHRSRWRRARWLVLAPHADDETIGCGALIVELAAAQRLAGVAFLTDGSGSHPTGDLISRVRLAAIRRSEARHALRLLAPAAPSPLFLDWQDAAPHSRSSVAFTSTARKLAMLCNAQRVDAIAVTGHDETHCDHVSAFHLAVACRTHAARPIDILEYDVWSSGKPKSGIAVSTRSLPPAIRNRALRQHRSQTTPLFGSGFRVPDHMYRIAAYDLLYCERSR